MPQFGQLIKNSNGKYKKLILDLTNYVNPISNKKEIFTREAINQMSTKEYSQQENKIFMQMNSIGIPTNSDLILSEKQDYKNNPTSQWIWVLDDAKKNHCDFCLKMEGEIFRASATPKANSAVKRNVPFKYPVKLDGDIFIFLAR